jgi:hypothetical protein
MGTGIGDTEKVMCAILNPGQLFAIVYVRAYSLAGVVVVRLTLAGGENGKSMRPS